MKALHLAITIAFSSSAVGCITNGNKSDSNLKSDQLIPSDTIVVQRSGKPDPVVSNLDRNAWVSVHKSGSGEQKMFAALAAGEFKAAIIEAQSFLQTHPKHRGALTVLASSYALTKDFEHARLYGRLLQRYHPGLPESLNIEGIAVMLRPQPTMMDFRQAAVLFEQAFTMNGSEIAAGLNLGNLYLEIGNADKAAEVLATVKNRCNGCTEARFSLGTALARIGKFDQANSEFQQIIDENPKDVEALLRLALVAKNGYNDLNKAKEYLRQVLALESKRSSPLYRQAHVMLRRLEGMDSRKMRATPVTAIAKDRKAPTDIDESDDGELMPASTTKKK